MEKNKVKKNVTVIIIALIVIIGLWLIIIYPLIKFNENEKTVINATKRYFEINSNKLPREGDIKTISVGDLLDQKYITDLRTAYNNDTCEARTSWVKVKKVNGDYKYYVYLKCGIFSSNVDHEGPEIVLNGDDKIEIEKGEKFVDPGVKSVKDNTDGNIDLKKVYTKGEVNTDKVGTYIITYGAIDSFENKTEVQRKVVVSQSLSNTVEINTDKDNIYKGAVQNNYIRFSGQLFRIVGLDSNGNVKIVSNEDIASVDYKSVNDWLNNYYYNNLAKSSRKYVVTNYEWCSDSVSKDKVDSVNKCNNKEIKQNVGLLSINEYNSSLKEGESYLYTNTINWTMNALNSKKAWTTKDNFIGKTSKYLEYSRNYNFKVRPSLVLKKGIKIKSGDGTVDNPYDIGDFKIAKPGSKVSKRYSGEYIKYGGNLYRIINSDSEGYTKVISIYNLADYTTTYGSGNQYNPNKADNIAYVIENTVSTYNKVGIFAKHQIEVPIYKGIATYSGEKTTKKYNVKFSAPSMYEMYSSYYDSFWYIESSKQSDIKYASSYNGTVYFDMDDITDINTHIMYTGYMKKTSVIISGSGTMSDPYEVDY